MDKKQLLMLFPDKDEFLIGTISDDIDLCREISFPVYVKYFYPPDIWSLLQKSVYDVRFETCGLNDNSEKKMICVIPRDYNGDIGDFPVTYFKITGPTKFDKLEHKDYLGSIMSLGLKREIMGDLIVKDNECFGIINKDMYDFLCNNLNKIKHSSVKISKILPDDVPNMTFKDMIETVASLRLDTIVSQLANVSRNTACDKIQAGEIMVNYQIAKEKSMQLEVNDIITIRKKGKFVISKYLNESKKGKSRILFKMFC